MVDGRTKRQHRVAPRECRRRGKVPSRSGAQRRGDGRRAVAAAPAPVGWRAVSYVSCREPSLGTGSLKAQIRATDAAAARLPAVVLTRYVDSGSCVDERGLGFALLRLEAEVEAGTIDVVVVEHISRFAADYAAALRFAVGLARTGVRIVEASGGPVRLGVLEAETLAGGAS